MDLTIAEKQKISWMTWYNNHSQEYNKKRSNARDKKRGYIAINSKHRTRDEPIDSKHRTRDEPQTDPCIKVRAKLSTIEKARRRIELDLAKTAAKQVAWREANNICI